MKLDKNQKVFLSYAWTGENEQTIRARMSTVCDFFQKNSIAYYCNLEDDGIKDFKNAGQFVKHALEQLQGCDVLLAIVSSERRSQGQLMEMGAALYEKMPVISALHTTAVGTGYLDDNTLVDKTFIWSDDKELVRKLEELL